jgi:hypothetical protein
VKYVARLEVSGTGSGSYKIVGFGVHASQHSGPFARVFVSKFITLLQD